ncbi:hypothetical protein [Streptomyces sp. NPDC005970]
MALPLYEKLLPDIERVFPAEPSARRARFVLEAHHPNPELHI